MYIASSEVKTKICSPFLPAMSFKKMWNASKKIGLN